MRLSKFNLKICDDKKEVSYNFYINGVWITITNPEGKVIWNRQCNSERNDWYDAKHKAIMDAVYALEVAIANTIE